MNNLQNKDSFYWHDYETFGLNTKTAGVAQFAGIRTDLDLNIIGKELNIICRTNIDRLPSPEASLITGISPMHNMTHGLSEVEFFNKINNELGKEKTCGIGYNNISFDDEITRNGLYRNFIDPYKREWANGCSRWDLLNIIRLIDVIKEGTIIIPIDPNTNKKSFKLDQLSIANGIEHENSHDALSDVIATIELAKLIKNKEPELFQMLFLQRKKASIENILLKSKVKYNATPLFKPFIMFDSVFSAKQSFMEVLFPVAVSGADLYCLRLTKNLDNLIEFTEEKIKERLFVKNEDLNDEEERIPFYTIKMNKCPVILPMTYITPEIAKKLNLSSEVLKLNIVKIKNNIDLIARKAKNILKMDYQRTKISESDVDTQIYNGFFEKADKILFDEIKATNASHLWSYLKLNKKRFKDERAPIMLKRYILRNFYEDVDDKTLDDWHKECLNRILTGKYTLTFNEYYKKIEELRIEHKGNEHKLNILKELLLFSEMLKKKLKYK